MEMPKLKTHRGAAKRFKVTGSGKIMRYKAYKGHLLTGKPAKKMRTLRKSCPVPDVLLPNIRKMLPYQI
jgi:large subunit ribosomal protein L35